jgi:hypothetical protein
VWEREFDAGGCGVLVALARYGAWVSCVVGSFVVGGALGVGA